MRIEDNGNMTYTLDYRAMLEVRSAIYMRLGEVEDKLKSARECQTLNPGEFSDKMVEYWEETRKDTSELLAKIEEAIKWRR